MPLDSTQWKLDDSKLAQVAARSTPATDALLVLTTEWQLATHQHTPTLYDAMAVTYALRPEICPTTPLRLQVDDKGWTRVVEGQVNAHACLKVERRCLLSTDAASPGCALVVREHFLATMRLLCADASRLAS